MANQSQLSLRRKRVFVSNLFDLLFYIFFIFIVQIWLRKTSICCQKWNTKGWCCGSHFVNYSWFQSHTKLYLMHRHYDSALIYFTTLLYTNIFWRAKTDCIKYCTHPYIEEAGWLWTLCGGLHFPMVAHRGPVFESLGYL